MKRKTKKMNYQWVQKIFIQLVKRLKCTTQNQERPNDGSKLPSMPTSILAFKFIGQRTILCIKYTTVMSTIGFDWWAKSKKCKVHIAFILVPRKKTRREKDQTFLRKRSRGKQERTMNDNIHITLVKRLKCTTQAAGNVCNAKTHIFTLLTRANVVAAAAAAAAAAATR